MNDDRIVKQVPRGTHITLTCKNHPTLSWSTKNIAPIGCRTIFYNLMDVDGMGRECDCTLSNLIPDPKY